MTAKALSEKENDALLQIMKRIAAECEADAVAVCDVGGNVFAQEIKKKEIGNAPTLAAASFAATRELAELIGEPGFKSISHKGQNSGIFIQSIGGDFLVMVILGPNSIEGLVRLFLKKVSGQIKSIVDGIDGKSIESAGGPTEFEVEKKSNSSEK